MTKTCLLFFKKQQSEECSGFILAFCFQTCNCLILGGYRNIKKGVCGIL